MASRYPTGRGFEGNGGEYLVQNQVNIEGLLDAAHLNSVHTSDLRVGLYSKVLNPIDLQVRKNDWVVAERVTHPRFASGGYDGSSYPLVHSAFNGDGAAEVAALPGRPDLQKAKLLSKWDVIGLAYEGKAHVSLNDTGGQQNLGVTVAGTSTHLAHENMYTGAIVMLRLPDPGERVARAARDPGAGVYKLIPTIKRPETVWKMVSAAVRRYIYELVDTPELRDDRQLRAIDPARDAHETFGDALVVFGLEFMKVLMDKGVIRVEHPAAVADGRFSMLPARADALEGPQVLLGLAKAFGIVPTEVDVPGIEMNFERRLAYHRLRKLLVATAFFDGESSDHAFHRGIDAGAVGWTKERRMQSPAQRVTQAQIDAPRKLVAVLEDLRAEANRWCVGTCIQGGPKDSSFRLYQKN